MAFSMSCARVHRLAALDDGVGAQATEDVDQSAPGNHGDDTHPVGPGRGALLRGLLAVEDPPVLGRHVTHIQLQELPVATCEVDDARRVVRVDVDLHQLGLADNEHRVAQGLDLASDQLGVEVVAFDEELGAVAPPTFWKVERDLRGRRRRLFRLRQVCEREI